MLFILLSTILSNKVAPAVAHLLHVLSSSALIDPVLFMVSIQSVNSFFTEQILWLISGIHVELVS